MILQLTGKNQHFFVALTDFYFAVKLNGRLKRLLEKSHINV